MQEPQKTKVMAVHSSKHQPLLLLMLLFVVAILCAAHAANQPSPNCKTSCGSVNIPFPFGTTEDCSLDSSFLIHCNKTTPYLPQTNLTVLNISLNGKLRISSPVASDCYADKGKSNNQTSRHWYLPDYGLYSISSSRNKLTTIGCDTLGAMNGYGRSEEKIYTTACYSSCDNRDDAIDGSCTGTGCCQLSIPAVKGLSEVIYGFLSQLLNNSDVSDFNPCGYVFLAEEGAYEFVSTDLDKFEKATFPVVLDWVVQNRTCREAQKNASSYACRADNSTCYNSGEGLGYFCNCSDGFRGNPYLLNGCQGIINNRHRA